MRRTAAALAIATFGLVTVVAPIAAADVAPPVDQISCGTGGPAVCDLLEQLGAQLAPVQPVLALADPLVGQLSTTVQDALTLSQTTQGVSSTEALDAVTALQSALDVLPAPVRDLLTASVLAPLQGTLDQLAAALAPVTEPVLGKPAATEEAKPTVMPTAPSTTTPEASQYAGDDLGGTALDSGSPASSSDLPDVPNGDVLDLGPLALPDFGWTADVSSSDDLAAPISEDQARLVAAAAPDGPLDTHGAGTGLILVAFSALLGALALAAQAMQQRRAAHTIPD